MAGGGSKPKHVGCATPDCDRPHHARGLCHRCYMRARDGGRVVDISPEAQVYGELARLRLTVEMLGAGIGGLLERGIVPPAVTRHRLVELWHIAAKARKPLAEDGQVAATVENILARHH